MVAAAVEALGGLDVLVNNAGISGQTAPRRGRGPRPVGGGNDRRYNWDVSRHASEHSSPEKIPCWKHRRDVVARRTLRISEPQRILHGKDGADRLRQNVVA